MTSGGPRLDLLALERVDHRSYIACVVSESSLLPITFVTVLSNCIRLGMAHVPACA
jgi:hypothetical protein